MNKWIIVPPKYQDIKYNSIENEYFIQYISSYNGCYHVKVETKKSKDYLELFNIVKKLKLEAKSRTRRKKTVTNSRF